MIKNGTYYGRKWTDKQLKNRSNKVYQVNESKNVVNIYKSTKHCGRVSVFSNAQVSIACRGERNTKKEKGHKYKGYFWYYEYNLPNEIKGVKYD